MDPKELKTTLKNAREAIRKKEFKDALKHCKTILTSDGEHYMALVLVAVAAEGLDQSEQALKAYKRAITADETQLLAWQGLASFYEKNPSTENKPEQINAYLKLISFYKDDQEKRFDTVCKLVQVEGVEEMKQPLQLQITEACLSVLKEAPGSEVKETVLRSLIPLIARSQRGDADQQILQLCAELFPLNLVYDTALESVVSIYLDVVRKQKPGKFVVCTEMYQKFPDSVSCLEHLVRCVLDSHIGLQGFSLSDAESDQLAAYERQTREEAGGHLLAVVNGYRCLVKKDWVSAQQCFQQGLDKSSPLVCAYVYQSVMCLRLHQNEAALTVCDTGLQMMNRKTRSLTVPSLEVKHVFHHVRVMALYAIGDKNSLNQALEVISTELPGDQERVCVWKGLVLLKLRQLEEAKACILGESALRFTLEGLVAQQEGRMEEATLRLEQALTSDPDCSDNYVHLALCVWDKDSKQAFTLLLKAAKLDPYASSTFMYLGHYYGQVAMDTSRARKCYQKAFDLDPKNEVAGGALCDLLTDDGEVEQAHRMLVDVTSRATPGSCKWAWLRLGLYQVKHDEPNTAISSLQSALRADPADNHVWECLGEAYMARGSYTAALKAFNKAVELSPGSMYCLYQIASIKQTLGSYKEAIEEYKQILTLSQNYVPALKGLGESYYLMAKSQLNKCFHGRACDTAALAVSNLWRAVTCRPDMSCLWKLLGDTCTILHVLPAQDFRFEKPDKTVLSKLETLELGGRFYARALKLLPECSSLWHDLGLNYFHQSKCCSEDAAIPLAEKSVAALKKAIQLEPTNHRHWTALGFVSCFDKCFKPMLAQHSFIKSIELEKNNVVAWTNLAALYLKHQSIKLAHEAFKVAQSLEPSYVACWVGQAIIAEMVGHEEAMDLFRHTTELGNHVESAVGYGHWVCQLVLGREDHDSYVYHYAIQQMAAIPAASDVLARYTDRVKTNALAYNLYGLLLERQKLYQTALRQFKQALVLLEKTPDAPDSSLLDTVRWNYARLLGKSGQYEEASCVYETLTLEGASCADLCQIGLAAYHAGNLQQAFTAYSAAAEKAESVADKSHVLAAVAMVTYKHGDLEGTKTTLFQGCQLSDPSPAGLKALCALGLIQSDVTLATAALQELFKLGGSNSHLRDTLLLSVVLEILQGNHVVAKRLIQRKLHMCPGEADLWRLLSAMLVRYFPSIGRGVCQSAQTSMILDKHGLQEDYPLVAAGELSQGYHGNQSHDALKSAQRAVHLYPANLEHWSLLASAVHGEALQIAGWDKRLALLQTERYILQYIQGSDSTCLELKLWCCKQEVVCLVHSGREGDVIDKLDMLLTQFGSDAAIQDFFNVFRNVLQGSHQGLSACLTDSSPLYYWQILCEMMITIGLQTEVVHTINLCLHKSRSRDDQLTLLLKLAHVLYQSGSLDNQQKLFDECIDQILALDPSNSAAHLMQGTRNIASNPRMAKHQLQKVVSYVTVSRGHDLSVARRALIYILNKMKKDNETIELVEDAQRDGDEETLNYYSSITHQDTP